MAPCIESVFLLDRMCYLHEKVLFCLHVRFLSMCVLLLWDPCSNIISSLHRSSKLMKIN